MPGDGDQLIMEAALEGAEAAENPLFYEHNASGAGYDEEPVVAEDVNWEELLAKFGLSGDQNTDAFIFSESSASFSSNSYSSDGEL